MTRNIFSVLGLGLSRNTPKRHYLYITAGVITRTNLNPVYVFSQVRQDAIQEMSAPNIAKDLDFILVVGGWDSSNTAHLLEIPVHAV